MGWTAQNKRRLLSTAGAAAVLAVAVAAAPSHSLVSPAWAQASGMFGTEQSDTVTMQATVKSVDLKNHTVVLEGADGVTKTLKVGPEVKNLPQVKAGDTVVIGYHESVAYVVAPAGSKSPEDLLAVATARATPGELPGGGVASKLVVTGLVVGVNPVTHSLSVVDPDGGQIHTFVVKNPDDLSMLSKIKVGDKITAIISDAIVALVTPVQ